MRDNLAQTLMEEFAEATGISGKAVPRRYLWTDSFAVCNFLGLFRQTGADRYLEFARDLVDQVHHVLGRHRSDDPRHGWISGLSEADGERHPTRGGLRIGKSHNERQPHQPPNPRLEWDRDGQYFHYLTKWMHALDCMAGETGEVRYRRWAAELAVTAHKAFTHAMSPGGTKGIVWKMSIDLTRPLVSSRGQHDPLDGLVACLELQANQEGEVIEEMNLTAAISDLTEMCAQGHWITDDPLGIGGMLDAATRLGQLVFERDVDRRALLRELLVESELSFQDFGRSFLVGRNRSVEHRLAFRELGLSIGMHGLRWLREFVTRDRELATASDRLLRYQPIADEFEAFWSDAPHRLGRTWMDHRDINAVMLATSLAPEGYFRR